MNNILPTLLVVTEWNANYWLFLLIAFLHNTFLTFSFLYCNLILYDKSRIDEKNKTEELNRPFICKEAEKKRLQRHKEYLESRLKDSIWYFYIIDFSLITI